jgi:hypothetical protein
MYGKPKRASVLFPFLSTNGTTSSSKKTGRLKLLILTFKLRVLKVSLETGYAA